MHAKLDNGDGHHSFVGSKLETWQSVLCYLELHCQTKANYALSFWCLVESQTIGSVPIVGNTHLYLRCNITMSHTVHPRFPGV